jgi:hypothetical protein
MSKEKEEVDYGTLGFEVDDTALPLKEVPKEEEKPTRRKPKASQEVRNIEEDGDEQLISCLRNERVIVRFIPKLGGIWGTNPKHLLAGGMAEGSVRVFVVPRLSSGMYINVLTDKEKAFLEDVMGLEYNALSIYKKVDNFWDDSNESGINKVRLTKQDNYLNLSNPEDYIRYKILLANKDFVAPSLQALQDRPKASYQFVIISENDETKTAQDNMSTTMKCYKEFGKIESDVDTLRVIIETIDGRPTSQNAKLEFLQAKANELIQSNNKLFLKVITDPMLPTKVFIKKSIEAGLISNRGGFLYLRSDNTPLCEANEEPTLNTAAKYLNSPKHQEIKFSLEAKLK